ncbi:MAG TPA: hypothetical protein VJT33_10280 [bacterium]|nr:hypothetical protein [bacterium]
MERKGRTRTGALPAVVAVVAMAVAVPVGAQSTGLKPVRDPQNRFTINVPAAWTVTTQSKNPAVEAKAPAPAAAGSAAALPDSLDVTVYDWRIPINAHDCISESDIVLRYAIHTWTTVRESSATVGGQPAYSRVYNWKAGNGEPRQSVETCVTHGNRVFVAVGTTGNIPARVNATMPLLERAIATLEPNLSVVPTPQPTAPGRKN